MNLLKVRLNTKGDSMENYKDFEEGIDTGTENLDEFAGVGKQKTSKSKVNLDAYDDLAVPDEDLADGGLAGLLENNENKTLQRDDGIFNSSRVQWRWCGIQ